MIITYYGMLFFRFQVGDLVVAANPVSKQAGVKTPRFGADIALVSLNDPRTNGAQNLSYGGKEPFVISGPGEYEVKGVSVRGFHAKTKYGGKDEQWSTIYAFNLDGINLCILGALSAPEVPEEAREKIRCVEILVVPVGGGALAPAEAHKLSLSFSPNVVIPAYGDRAALKKFLEEAGSGGAASADKLTVKKKDIEGKEVEIIVLDSL